MSAAHCFDKRFHVSYIHSGGTGLWSAWMQSWHWIGYLSAEDLTLGTPVGRIERALLLGKSMPQATGGNEPRKMESWNKR